VEFKIPDLASCKTVEEMALAIDSMKARLAEIQSQYGVQPLPDEERAEWDAIDNKETGALVEFEKAKAEAKVRLARIDELAKDPQKREDPRRAGAFIPSKSRIPENLYDLAEYRSRTMGEPRAMLDLMRDGALKASEQWSYPHEKATPENSVEHIHKLLARPRPQSHIEHGFDSGKFAEHLLTAGSPEYEQAFWKTLAAQAKGLPPMLSPREQAAIASVATTTTGGYMVPVQLDPTILLTSDGAVNPLRQMARVEQITTGNRLQVITSSGVTASFGTEAATVADGAPTIDRPYFDVQKAKVRVDFSIEADEDISGLRSQLAAVIQSAKDDVEAEKFVNGTGTNEPEGVLYGIASTYNVGTTGDGFDLEDLARITGKLPDRWEPRASWLAHRAIYSEAERLDRAAGGGSVYRPLAAGAPNVLLGYPRFNSSTMESDYTTDTNRVAIFGDFKQFIIGDKIGLTVEFVPHVFDGSGYLTGQRALFAYWRTGSVVAIDSAFRVLTIGVVTSGV
jgi:HK97 family phage major capsid protein